MKPVGTHHVNLMFDDIDASREFYRDVTGRTCGRLICDRPSFLRLNSAANTLCWTQLRPSRIA